MATVRDTIGSEYLESILRDWTRNLWMANNQARMTDDASKRAVENELQQKMFPNNDRGLTKTQRFSEQSFTYLAFGLAYMDSVSRKAADAISGSRLVDAWRKTVLRDSFQQKYDLFDATLKTTLDTAGADAAAAQYPKTLASADQVIEALQTMGYKTRAVNAETVAGLIRKATAAPPATAPKPKTP